MPEPSPAALARVRRLGAGFDADHGGPDAFGDADHGIGIGIEQGLIVGGRRLGGLRGRVFVE